MASGQLQIGLADTWPRDLSLGSGATVEAIAAKDWSVSSLGAPEQWPQSLRVMLDVCLHSAFPMVIFWGRDLSLLYNDAYHAFLTDKHPRALGQPARDVWPEIWDVIGPMLHGVLLDGKATRSEDLQLHTMRNGRREEGYFTFSYSPIPDDDGTIGGVFCPVVETTERVIGERRLRTLRDLAALGRAESDADACRTAAKVLALNNFDLPFVLIYCFDERRSRATLVASAGIAPGQRASLMEISLGEAADDLWGIEKALALRAGQVELRELGAWFGDLPRGAWSSPPTDAALLPIVLPGEDLPAAAMIAAVSPRKRWDVAYSYFLDRVAAKIASAMCDARAYAAEHRRAEEIRSRERALARAEAELREAQRLGRIGSWRWSGSIDDGGEASEYFSRIFRLDPGRPLPSFAKQKGLLYAPDVWNRLNAAMQTTLRTGNGFDLDLPARRADGVSIWITIRAEAVRDDNGGVAGLRSTVQNITERRQAQEQVELLMQEVTHRAKNLLTVVRAVARQTARKDSPQNFAELFDQRIAALGASHDLLVQNDWRGVDLHEMTRSQLAHFRDLLGSRIRVDGRPVMVRPAASQALGMALHELATNAGKYGALSTDEGKVHISFDVRRDGDASSFVMSWRESGGPPVAPPDRPGFGHMVIVQMAKHALGGDVTLDYAPTGVVWEIRAPLENVVEAAPGDG